MITVHVWDSAWLRYLPAGKGGSPGHAAISFGSYYVSFWPGEQMGFLTWKGHKVHTFEEDDKVYKDAGQEYWSETLPDNSAGPGLNELLMEARWIDIRARNPNYTAEFQCSAVVNELLIAGEARKYLVNKWYRPATWVLVAVSPADVKNYVKALKKAIDAAGR